MQNAIQHINKLVKQLKSQSPISMENKCKLEEKFQLEFNFNSNHIEGNTLTYGETKLLLMFDKTEGVHELREFEEMKAHDVAYQLIQEWANDTERPLTEAYIKQLNETILVRPFWKEAITEDGQSTRRLIKVGDYKEHPNSVMLQSGKMFHYASPIDTPVQMGELMQWYNDELEKKELYPVELAALLHYKFACIHPFDDGNGRISRLLMNYVLLKNNLPPVIIKSIDKKNYLNALNQADTGNVEAFVKYIAEQLVWSLEIVLKAAKGEDIEEVDDIDKRIALIDKRINNIDNDKELKKQFNKEVFEEILHTWLKDLIVEIVPVIQRFNKYYLQPNHTISYSSGPYVNFNDEPIETILSGMVNHEYNASNRFNEHDFSFYVRSFYGPFKKGGLNSFGCTYSIEIKFEQLQYRVFIDEFSGIKNSRNQTEYTERLLHKPLTKSDITTLKTKLQNSLVKHLEFYMNENNII